MPWWGWSPNPIGREGVASSRSRSRSSSSPTTHGLPVLQPERLRDEAFLDALSDLTADLGVVAAYGKILTRRCLQTPRLGLINVHASLLPKYRGAAPIHRAVMAGETETGVTIMRVVKALDAGPMMANGVAADRQRTKPALDVERDLAQIGARALVEAWSTRLAQGLRTETPQDESQATYAPKLEKGRRHRRLVAVRPRDSQSDSRPPSVAACLLAIWRASAPSS